MVRGIDKFRLHFAGHGDKYALIGGAACHLSFDELDLSFRPSKDIDMVLCVDVVDAGFAVDFMKFIEAGGYRARERGDGRKEFYRFHKPEDADFPYMIELLSRRPESLNLPEEATLSPIPVEKDMTSLSAILLDETCFSALRSATRPVDGITILDQSLLVPFKARAFLNLTESKEAGESVKSSDIRKHRDDVLLLTQILPHEGRATLPERIKDDLRLYIEVTETDDGIDFDKLDIGRSREEAFAFLREFYSL